MENQFWMILAILTELGHFLAYIFLNICSTRILLYDYMQGEKRGNTTTWEFILELSDSVGNGATKQSE